MVLLFDRVLLGALRLLPLGGSSLAHLWPSSSSRFDSWVVNLTLGIAFESELDSSIVSQRSLGGNWATRQDKKSRMKENTDDEANRLWVSIRARSVISRGLVVVLLLGPLLLVIVWLLCIW